MASGTWHQHAGRDIKFGIYRSTMARSRSARSRMFFFSAPRYDSCRFPFRRRVLKAAGAGALMAFLPGLACSQAWKEIDALRSGLDGTAVANEGLQLSLPLVAEDGSSVPLGVTWSGPGDLRVKRLELYAPRNPAPQIAVFEFAPEASPLNLATRIRLSESQTVVAVATTEDGTIHVAERDVRVTTSGCVPPAKSDPAAEMKARVRLPKASKAGTPVEILTMISHPMITGLTADASGQMPQKRIIERFEATLDGQPVLRAEIHRSLAANPYLKFEFTPSHGGEMRFVWQEDTGRETVVTEAL